MGDPNDLPHFLGLDDGVSQSVLRPTGHVEANQLGIGGDGIPGLGVHERGLIFGVQVLEQRDVLGADHLPLVSEPISSVHKARHTQGGFDSNHSALEVPFGHDFLFFETLRHQLRRVPADAVVVRAVERHAL